MIFLLILPVHTNVCMLCVLPYLYVAHVASKRVMDVVKDLHAEALCIPINDNQRKLRYKCPAWLVSEY